MKLGTEELMELRAEGAIQSSSSSGCDAQPASFERILDDCKAEFSHFGESRLANATLPYRELVYSLQAISPRSPGTLDREEGWTNQRSSSVGSRQRNSGKGQSEVGRSSSAQVSFADQQGGGSERSTFAQADIQHPFLRHVTEQIEGLQRCHDMSVEGLERQLAEFRKQFRSLEEDNSKNLKRQLQLKWQLEAALDSVKCVRAFCTLNYLALQRVLEEFDRTMGSKIAEIIMWSVVETRRFAEDCLLFEGGAAAEIQTELEHISSGLALFEASSSKIGIVMRKILTTISGKNVSSRKRGKNFSNIHVLENMVTA